MDGNCSSKVRQMGKKHALILPVILHGHFAGIYRLAVQLAERGVIVTFVALENQIAFLNTVDKVQELGFNLVPYKVSGPSGPNLTIFDFLDSARDLFDPILNRLLEDQKAGLAGPTCIIGDMFLAWATDVAKKLNIPYYQFFSCGAVFARSLQACPKLFADGILTMEEKPGGKKSLADFEGLLKIPGLPALQSREMTNSAFGVDFTNAIGVATGEADGVIVNTFYELEVQPIDAIRQSWIQDCRGKSPKLFLVGPLSTLATFTDRPFSANSVRGGTSWLQWLDGRPPKSVLYACAGSIVNLNSQQIMNLALALEASEASFLLVLPPASEGKLPQNFQERMRRRGLVVSEWVPQLQLLGHSAIGGFLTHCGWNSIVESIACGIPMAAWPQLRNDQFINCRHVVDVLKIAVEVRPQNSSSGPNESEALASAVRLLMSDEGNVLRSRVQELKRKAEAAVGDGGVSIKALNDLAESIPTGRIGLLNASTQAKKREVLWSDFSPPPSLLA